MSMSVAVHTHNGELTANVSGVDGTFWVAVCSGDSELTIFTSKEQAQLIADACNWRPPQPEAPPAEEPVVIPPAPGPWAPPISDEEDPF